jgi:uncharacterized Zn finger protein (UPF0148 family)
MGVILCESCGSPRQKHVACPKCGTYKGNKVIDHKAKADKKIAKKQAADAPKEVKAPKAKAKSAKKTK